MILFHGQAVGLGVVGNWTGRKRALHAGKSLTQKKSPKSELSEEKQEKNEPAGAISYPDRKGTGRGRRRNEQRRDGKYFESRRKKRRRVEHVRASRPGRGGGKIMRGEFAGRREENSRGGKGTSSYIWKGGGPISKTKSRNWWRKRTSWDSNRRRRGSEKKRTDQKSLAQKRLTRGYAGDR